MEREERVIREAAGNKEDSPDAPVVFLISWNIAGFTSLHTTIRNHYGDLGLYLNRMKCDIFCAQETKLQATSLCPGVDSSRFAKMEGYVGYWVR